jgi:L-malate glycosyltransferase
MVSHANLIWTPYFARFFLERGYSLKVLSFSPYVIEGVDVEFIGVLPYDANKNKHAFFSKVPRIRRIIRAFRPDVVFATYLSSNGLSAALSWTGPLVVAAVGSDVFNNDGRSGFGLWLRELSIKYVCRRADLINVVSQGLADELVRLRTRPSKILQINFGTDVDRFGPAPDMPRLSASRFICTRKHEQVYDIATILEGLALLKRAGRSFHCVFAGEGTLTESLKTRAHDLGLDVAVSFVGSLNHEVLPAILRNCDVYISASLSDGTSVSLLEAMASGLLPVVSRIPANVPWVEHDRTGLLFDVGHPADLAVALTKAMDDADLRRRAFHENRARVERDGSMKSNQERLAGEIERIVGARRANRPVVVETLTER